MNRKEAGSTTGNGSLPYDAKAESEIVSAVSLFTVNIESVSATQWKRGDDGLEHRTLSLTFKVGDVFKGSVEAKRATVVNVTQGRESQVVESDFHGVWSHVRPEPAAGIRYAVFSGSGHTDVGEILDDESKLRLMSDSVITEVKFAVDAQRIMATTLDRVTKASGSAAKPGDAVFDPQLAAAHDLIAFTSRHESELGGVYARYLWYYLLPIFRKQWREVAAETIELVKSGRATPALREALAYSLYMGVIDMDSPGDLVRRVARAFLDVTVEGGSEALTQKIVDVYLYNLALKPSGKPLDVMAIVPDDGTRRAMRAAIDKYTSERARLLKTWLEGGEMPGRK